MGPQSTSIQQYKVRVDVVSLWCVLALVSLLPFEASGTNPGVKVKLTQKGLEYGRQIGIPVLQEKLKTINVPDISGTADVLFFTVSYRLTGIWIVGLGIPGSSVGLVAGNGVTLSINNAYINLRGNWHVSYLFIDDDGTFDLSVSRLVITTTIAVMSDETGRPAVSMTNCGASVGQASINFHGGLSWLYNLFSDYIDDGLRSAIQSQICPLVSQSIDKMTPYLKTLNVLAQVDKYAEIEYPLVESPVVSESSIVFGMKGEFYNIGQHKEPPFSPVPFSLPPQDTSMLYIAVSTFTLNSAGFVYNKAGALRLQITDDMIPPSSPFRLNTTSFGSLIPQIAKQYPGLMMKLLVKTDKQPTFTFAPDNVTLQASGTVTAFAIQPNATLTPLFVLNLNSSVSAKIYVSGVKVFGTLTLNRVDMTLGTSYVGPFKVSLLDIVVKVVLNGTVIPKVNTLLQEGFPLPTIGKMNLVNTQLQVLKDYILIGTDVQFSG